MGRRLFHIGLIAIFVCLVRCGSGGGSNEECTEDADCVNGVCVANQCVDCRENSDCQRSGHCVDNVCVARASCSGSEDCDSGVCIDNMCMDCLISADCEQGYICQDNVCVEGTEECQGNATCNNHGTCDDSSGTIVCTCDTGYTGDRCESCAAGYHDEDGSCVPDEACQDDTCNGHGECDDTGGVITCDCDDGYAGDRCDSCAAGYAEWPADSGTCVDDPCDPYPCDLPHAVPNGCVQTAADEYICTCEEGYTWSGTECTDTCEDNDDDNHGVGPGCMGPDCDDNDPDVFEGNPETCDGKDNDCDGRTDCEGGACSGDDPCVDDDPCTEDTCDYEGDGCAHGPLEVPQDTDCDPDGDGGNFELGDGVCTAEMTCLRKACQLCENDEECIGAYCVCADDTCTTKRCWDDSLLCQYLDGDETNCSPVNTPDGRQGAGCNEDDQGSDNWVCNGGGECKYLKCADCDTSGCTYDDSEDADCGNSTDCGVCSALNACNLASLGTDCSFGPVTACRDHCDGSGTCVAVESENRACGTGDCAGECNSDNECGSLGTACAGSHADCGGICTAEGECGYGSSNGDQCADPPCPGSCSEGACNLSASNGDDCGSGNCASTCSNGTCSSSGDDCGTCCICNAAGVRTYDSSQNSDCSGYSSLNPCSNRCATAGSCGYPGSSTACGYGGWCEGSCDGAGSCNSEGDVCCSKMGGHCTASDECLGHCNSVGICDSTGDACGTSCGGLCDGGFCSVTGGCRCNQNNCSGCVDLGSGYDYFMDFCSNILHHTYCCHYLDHGVPWMGCCTQPNCNGDCIWF